MDKFTLRLSWLPAIQNLADAERGRLLTALMEYAETQEPKELSGNERYVYNSLVREIDEERLVQIAQDSVQIAQDVDIESNNITLPSEEGSKNAARLLLSGMFEEFWKAYPVHVNKKRCIALWEKIRPDEALFRKMLDSIEAWKKSERWQAGYIRDPDTWLRNENWNDEVPPPPRSKHRGPDTFFNYQGAGKSHVNLADSALSMDDFD